MYWFVLIASLSLFGVGIWPHFVCPWCCILLYLCDVHPFLVWIGLWYCAPAPCWLSCSLCYCYMSLMTCIYAHLVLHAAKIVFHLWPHARPWKQPLFYRTLLIYKWSFGDSILSLHDQKNMQCYTGGSREQDYMYVLGGFRTLYSTSCHRKLK